MVIVVEIKADGAMVGALVANAKQFKTGSRGFFGTGKVEIAGKRYQTQIQFVEIGSKANPEPAPDSTQGEAPQGGGAKEGREA